MNLEEEEEEEERLKKWEVRDESGEVDFKTTMFCE